MEEHDALGYIGRANNPEEGQEVEEPTEFYGGKWRTKEEFVEWLNQQINGRAGFVVDDHYEGLLGLTIKFEGGE
jgi:hypothetical protein